jgi:hypothetical protein
MLKHRNAPRRNRVAKKLIASTALGLAPLLAASPLMPTPLASAQQSIIFVNDAHWPSANPHSSVDASTVASGNYLDLPGWDRLDWLQNDFTLGALSGPKSPGYDASLQTSVGLLDELLQLRVAANNPGATAIVGLGAGADTIAALLRQYAASGDTYANSYAILFGSAQDNDGGFITRFAGLPFKITLPLLGMTLGGPSGVPASGATSVATVAIQYDGYADFPKYALNGLAVLNAIAGFYYLHGGYGGVDLGDPNLVYSYSPDGITHVLVPTDMPPLLTFAVKVGIMPAALAEALKPLVKAAIEAGYDRPAADSTQYSDQAVGFQLLPSPEKFQKDAQSVFVGAQQTGQALGQLLNDQLAILKVQLATLPAVLAAQAANLKVQLSKLVANLKVEVAKLGVQLSAQVANVKTELSNLAAGVHVPGVAATSTAATATKVATAAVGPKRVPKASAAPAPSGLGSPGPRSKSSGKSSGTSQNGDSGKHQGSGVGHGKPHGNAA